VRSGFVVFAANAYSILFPELKNRQYPVFTHIVLTEPLSEERMQAIGWRCRAGVEDARDLIHYYRLTRDNRIVMGGGDISIGCGADFDKDLNPGVFHHLKDHLLQIFPQLSGIRFTHEWGGPVSVTADMAPAIGWLGQDKRAVFALGCIGHGVSLTTYNGLTIAELICGHRTERTEMFFVGRKTIPWPPEPITYAGAHAIRAFMRLEDRLYYK
jgi:glycine/D-amino acid oxidase-like deaminating enzyme